MKKQIAGRDIFAWAPGVERDKSVGHTVLIVGAAKIEEKEYVYFIDPNDPSDPKDRTKQKIYAISYKNLSEHISNLMGTQYSEASTDHTVFFAYHGNFKP